MYPTHGLGFLRYRHDAFTYGWPPMTVTVSMQSAGLCSATITAPTSVAAMKKTTAKILTDFLVMASWSAFPGCHAWGSTT